MYVYTLNSILKIIQIHKRFYAAVLLLIFSLAITPRKYWHDVLSVHTDYCFHTDVDNKVQLTNYKFNCGFVEIAASQNFLAHDNFIPENAAPVTGCFQENFTVNLFFKYFTCFSHRGPPIA